MHTHTHTPGRRFKAGVEFPLSIEKWAVSTGTEPGNLIIYTEPVDANEPITDPCDRILMGILADEYSPQHISDFLGISLADLNYLMKQEHLQFFINSLSLLYESSFSTNAINHFHEALQDYKDSQNPITDLEFVYSSFDDMLEKDAQKQNVIDFLVQNNYSDEAFAFLREAMPALQDNDGDGQPDAEVDWEDSLIYILPECLDNIVLDLILSSNGKFSKVMDKFVGHSTVPKNFNWSIIAENANGLTDANASTNPTVKHGSFVETRIYYDNIHKGTDISVARTIIHEGFHAYLVFVYRYQNIDKSYKSLLDEYGSNYNNNANDTHHAFFILENIISEIALALKEFGQKQGYNLSNQFYSDMAWGGLTHIKDPSNTNNYILNPIFKEAVPNQTDQQRILNTLSAEQLSQTVNGIAPKGVQVCP